MMLRWTRLCCRVHDFVDFASFSRHARWVHWLDLSISRSIPHAQRRPKPRSNRMDSLYKTGYFVFAVRIHGSIVMVLSRYAVHVYTMVSLKISIRDPQRPASHSLLEISSTRTFQWCNRCPVLDMFHKWSEHCWINQVQTKSQKRKTCKNGRPVIAKCFYNWNTPLS